MPTQPAVQLYTVRDFLATEHGFAESLEKIGKMGYPAVQLSAVGAMNGEYPAVSAPQARQMLDDNGLRCIATHRSWNDLVHKTESEIEFHKTLGCDFAAIGGVPPPYNSEGADGFRRWAGDAAPVIARLKEAGIRFGYHNHAFEFQTYGPDRQWLYSIFMEEAGPDLLLELDLYWANHAGVNPVRIIEKAPGRLPVVHLKDVEMDGNNPVMAPVGEGNLDWSVLLPALQAAGTEWVCVEQDTCRRDPFDCLRSSFEYLQRALAAA
jgi:sugar phosphate isomerase/epimerase